MNSVDFVDRIRVVVYESSVEACLSVLKEPPGRQPSRALTELSQWYNQLSPHDRERVRAVIQLSVRAGVFGMLTVLDGVTSIREGEEELGTLELLYKAGGRSILLNGPTGEFLHDIFAGQVPPT